jgi:hypothetical protein
MFYVLVNLDLRVAHAQQVNRQNHKKDKTKYFQKNLFLTRKSLSLMHSMRAKK